MIRSRRVAWMRVPLAAAAWLYTVSPAAAQFPDGPGKDVLEKQCSTCHSPDMVMAQRRSAEEWHEIILSMVDLGAEINEEQTKVLIEYLSKHWGTGEAPAAEPPPAGEKPSGEPPPAGEPVPGEQPPAGERPAEEPPASNPPAEPPPAAEPPAQQAPAEKSASLRIRPVAAHARPAVR